MAAPNFARSLFSVTRKWTAAPSAQPMNYQKAGISLVDLEPTQMSIYSYYKNPAPGKRSGRSITRKTLRGPTVQRWWPEHIRATPGLFHYRSETERYRMAKNSYMRTRGQWTPKKGSGKKALKRAADAKKAAAKSK